MDYSVQVDPVAKLRILKLSGEAAAGDFYSLDDRLYDHPDFDISHRSLWDLRDYNLQAVSGDDVSMFARFIGRQRMTRGAPPKSAVVVVGDLSFGLLRQYESYLDGGDDFRLFRDMDEAIEWLMTE